jgi:hypothetical protein
MCSSKLCSLSDTKHPVIMAYDAASYYLKYIHSKKVLYLCQK